MSLVGFSAERIFTIGPSRSEAGKAGSCPNCGGGKGLLIYIKDYIEEKI
jgi:hypothetical protein